MTLEEQIKIAVEGCDVSLYEITNAKDNDSNIFRVTITAVGGITHDKCQEISKIISPLLDIQEPMKGKYLLEVSSPGIERKLKSLEHVQASVGENIKGKEYSSESFKGKLISVEDDILTVLDEQNEKFKIAYNDVLSISTYYEWKK